MAPRALEKHLSTRGIRTCYFLSGMAAGLGAMAIANGSFVFGAVMYALSAAIYVSGP